MKIIKSLGLLAVVLGLGLGLSGCSQQSDLTATSGGGDDFETMDMDKAYGGLTVSDEAADFGDAEFSALDAADADAETEDVLQDDLEVLGYEDAALADAPTDSVRPRPVITVLRLTWGQLDGLPEDLEDPVDAMDWSGLLSVDRGVVVARRLILFEKPRDHLVHPRSDRRTVAWVSHTGRHYDGLIVEIIEPPLPPAEAADAAPNMFHLRTPQIALELPVADLAGLDRTATVDDQGNALQLEGFHLGDVDLCPKGFLGGVWVADPRVLDDGTEVPGGWFQGRWMSIWGRPIGVMRGRYGVNEAGERVFFGKTIQRNGRFMALIEGTWSAGEEPGQGTFRGAWANAAMTVEGVLGGRYLQLAERPGGYFGGRYAGLCDGDAETID